MHGLSEDNVSKSLAKIAPPSLVDLYGDSDEEELIKRNVDEMDEDSKNQCLMLFFKFWREKWRKQQKSIQIRNAFFHDEAGCDDSNVSSDEPEDEENEYDPMTPLLIRKLPTHLMTLLTILHMPKVRNHCPGLTNHMPVQDMLLNNFVFKNIPVILQVRTQ